MKHSRSLMLPPALLAFILPAVLLNPNLEKLLAHGFLALVFYFALAIFHAEQLAHRPSPRYLGAGH